MTQTPGELFVQRMHEASDDVTFLTARALGATFGSSDGVRVRRAEIEQRSTRVMQVLRSASLLLQASSTKLLQQQRDMQAMQTEMTDALHGLLQLMEHLALLPGIDEQDRAKVIELRDQTSTALAERERRIQAQQPLQVVVAGA